MSKTTNYETVDECIAARPRSLTAERALSFLPELTVCPEWQRKRDAGELDEGIRGIGGMLRVTWPDIVPTRDEALWLLALREFGSWRWCAAIVTHGDSNQIHGIHLEAAARKAMQ